MGAPAFIRGKTMITRSVSFPLQWLDAIEKLSIEERVSFSGIVRAALLNWSQETDCIDLEELRENNPLIGKK